MPIIYNRNDSNCGIILKIHLFLTMYLLVNEVFVFVFAVHIIEYSALHKGGIYSITKLHI